MKSWADLGINVHGITSQGKTLCPWCSSTRKNKTEKCLSVNLDDLVYQCFHCGIVGTLKEYEPSTVIVRPVFRKPVLADLPTPESTLAWFATRGIGEEVVGRNHIRRIEHFMPQLGKEVPCIVFPYYRRGELVNAKYRDADKNFCMEAKAERILYGYDDIADDVTIICEGEIDKLSIEQAGFPNCVSVPNGAPPPKVKNYGVNFSYLDDDRIGEVKAWVIAVDNDPPGTRLEQELCRRFGANKCKRVTWPDGCKDANDVLMLHGRDTLRACIENAKPFPIAGVVSVADVRRELILLYREGVRRGLTTGWKSLDEFYTVRPGEVTVVTGVPNSGKSNWVDGLCVNLAKEHGWKFGVFSPENQPLHNHMSRLMEHYARVPFRDGPTRRMSEPDMEICADWLGKHFQFMLPDDETEWTVQYIIETAEALVQRYGVNAIVIDPWNELEHSRPEGQTETEYVGSCLKRFRQFARRCHIHLWLVAHPTKMYRNKNGEYPVPTLYDISGSAHFRNKADNGIVIWRDLNEPNKRAVEIHVQKVRFREVGKIGGCELLYDAATGAYDDPFKTMAAAQTIAKQRDGTEAETPAPAWWDQ
jgi:twinkle protein